MTRLASPWIRAGLILLAALQAVVSIWQYVFPHSFFVDFPTVELDPPYNEHLVSDVGGLGLALTVMLVIGAVTMTRQVVLTALTGYLIYAATHFAFHVSHFEHFDLRDALSVGTGLGVEVVLTLVLLFAGWRSRSSSAPVPVAGRRS